MPLPTYSGLHGTTISRTVHRGTDTVIQADTEVFRKVLQSSSTITLHRVTQIVCRLDRVAADSQRDHEVDVVTWYCRGEIESLTFVDGIASLTTNTYGPGDKWTTVWLIRCDRVNVETRYLTGKTIQALVRWIRDQWLFWAALIIVAVVLLARFLQKS